MMKCTHPLVDQARKGINPRANLLRRALIEARGSKGEARKGATLAGGRHLLNTYTSARRSEVNNDRYKRREIKPSVSAEVSILLDISGSMEDRRDGRRGNATIMEEAMGASIAMSELLAKLKVPHSLFGCDVEHYDQAGWRDHPTEGATHPYRGVLYPFTDKRGLAYAGEQLMRFCPRGGTYIASYAEEAVRALEGSRATHKLAVYMTDGACNSVAYLPSLALMAEAQGITLVGVVMGHASMASEASKHPNGVFCPTASEFGSVVVKHLTDLVKKS